jgi:hypothetical protein
MWQQGMAGELMAATQRQAIRRSIEAHIGERLPTPPPPPRIEAYGTVGLSARATLLSQLPRLYPGDGVQSRLPRVMEEYGQPCGPGPCDALAICQPCWDILTAAPDPVACAGAAAKRYAEAQSAMGPSIRPASGPCCSVSCCPGRVRRTVRCVWASSCHSGSVLCAGAASSCTARSCPWKRWSRTAS